MSAVIALESRVCCRRRRSRRMPGCDEAVTSGCRRCPRTLTDMHANLRWGRSKDI